MGLEKSQKQSYEKYFMHGDFSDVMEEGETITSGVCTAEDNTGADATSVVLDPGSEYAEGFFQYFRVMDGEELLSPYKITVRIVTSIGNKWEVDGNLIIKEK